MDFKSYEHETKKAQKEYDIMVTQNGGNIKYEIKCDRLSNKTGNVCIEITCNGKPSGISSTTSDYWAYFVLKDYQQYDLYIIPIDELRDIVFTNDYKVIRGGDNKKCELILIPLTKFKKYIVNNFPSHYNHEEISI
jgi:hypothetical protein